MAPPSRPGALSAPSHPTLATSPPIPATGPPSGRTGCGWEAPRVPAQALGPGLRARPRTRTPGPRPDSDPLGSEPFALDPQAHVTLTVRSAPVPSMQTYPLEAGSDPHHAGWQGRAECLSGVTRQGRGGAADPTHPPATGSRGASQTRETADPLQACRSSGR